MSHSSPRPPSYASTQPFPHERAKKHACARVRVRNDQPIPNVNNIVCTFASTKIKYIFDFSRVVTSVVKSAMARQAKLYTHGLSTTAAAARFHPTAAKGSHRTQAKHTRLPQRGRMDRTDYQSARNLKGTLRSAIQNFAQ